MVDQLVDHRSLLRLQFDHRFHVPDKILLRFIDLSNPESPFAVDLNVHLAVVVVVDMDDSDGRADHIRVGDAADLRAVPNQDDAERSIVVEAVLDHRSVPFLEHVQLDRGVREQDGMQRKEGQRLELSGHGVLRAL